MTSSASKDFATATAIITFRVNVTSVAIKLIEFLKEYALTNDIELVTNDTTKGTWITVSGSRQTLVGVLRYAEGHPYINFLPFDPQGVAWGETLVTPAIATCFQNFGLANWVLLKSLNRYGFASVKDASATTASMIRTRSIFSPSAMSRSGFTTEGFKQFIALRSCEEQIELECAIIKHLDCPSKHTRLDIIMELADVFFYTDRTIPDNNPLVESATPSFVVQTFNRVAKLLGCGSVDLIDAIDATHKIKKISHQKTPF